MNNIHDNQRVAVSVDVQNLYYSAKNLYDTKVNYTKLLKKAVSGRKLTRALAYAIKADTPDESNFFEALRKIGFEVQIKNLKEFKGGQKKGDWDMGMAIDAIELAGKIDVLVLVTGDGDFESLVKHMQARGVRVEVMSFGRSTARELKDSCDHFLDMDEKKNQFLI